MARRRYRGRGSYKYTPRRQAALRKAQLASARKRRRRQRARNAAVVVGGITAVFATKQINRWGNNPREIGRDYRDIKKGVVKLRNSRAARKVKRAAKRSSMKYTIQSGPWV
jgi:phosphosulfolactate synthase (CoM biosynthesis protein A)